MDLDEIQYVAQPVGLLKLKLNLCCKTDVMGVSPFSILLLRADLLFHFP